MTQEKYEVESIKEAVVVWKKKGTIRWKYLVKWKGYTDNENTWEPTESFDTPALINEFWRNTDTGGRDIRKARDFKVGERFVPRTYDIGSKNAQKSPRNISKTVRFDSDIAISDTEQNEAEEPRQRKRRRVSKSPTPSTSTPKRRHALPEASDGVVEHKSTSISPLSDSDVVGSVLPNPMKRVEVVIVRERDKAHIGIDQNEEGDVVDSPQAVSPHHSLFSEDEDEAEVAVQPEIPQQNGASTATESPARDVPSPRRPVSIRSVAQPSGSESHRVPAHRSRKPLVKMVEEPLVDYGPGRAIATKAKLIARLRGSSSKSASTPASPSSTEEHSTKDPNNLSPNHAHDSDRILSADERNSSLNGSSTSHSSLHFSDIVDESLLAPAEINAATLDIDAMDVDPPEVTVSVPTSADLLALAGVEMNNSCDLPDFEQDAEGDTDPDIHPEPNEPGWRTGGPSSLIQPYVGMSSNSVAFSTSSDTTDSWAARSRLFASVEDPFVHSILVPLDPSTSIRAELKNITASSFGTSFQLDSLLPPACTGPPGKLYDVGVLRHLSTGGSCAQLSEDDVSILKHKQYFEILRHKLDGGQLFIGVFCGYVLVFCTTQNCAACEDLRIPKTIMNDPLAIIVSHVMIENDSGFADFAMQAEDLALNMNF